MFEIGQSLRQARERQGLELAAVEAATRIRVRYLAALEEERFDLLPTGEAYAKAFLRGYAECLGLDGQLYIDEYNARFPEAEPPPPARTRPQLAPRWVLERAGVALVAFVAIAVLGVLAWKFGGSHHAPTVAGISPLAPSSRRAGPPLARPTRLATKPAAAPTLAKLLLAAAGGDCWLSVRVGSQAGQVLYEGLLREGSSLRFARTRLWIRVGAPWNLNARLDGKPLEQLPRHTGNVLVTRAGVHLL